MDKKTFQIMITGLFLLCCPLLSAAEMLTVTINKQIFVLTIAKTMRQHREGLMYKYHLPEHTGMIFPVNPIFAHNVEMWMKNTYIPLDMLFIGPDYQINCIIKNTQPNALKRITCPYPTRAVIEINGGESEKHHLTKGMKVLFKKDVL